MATIPVNNWVSIAGVRDHRRPDRSARATSASAIAVPIPIRVIATPLARWYEWPLAVATAAKTEAARTATASTASMTAAAITERGNGALSAAVADRAGWTVADWAGGTVADRVCGAVDWADGDRRVDGWLAWARARALDREPTRHLHNPRATGCHRPG